MENTLLDTKQTESPNYCIIQTEPIQERVGEILNGYSIGEHVRVPLINGKKIYDDFIIKGYSEKDKTFTVYKEINNGVITTKISKEMLDYYNKEEYKIGQKVIIIIKGNVFEGEIIKFDKKENKYLIKRRKENEEINKWFSKKRIDNYQNSVARVLGTNEYYINGHRYLRTENMGKINFILIDN